MALMYDAKTHSAEINKFCLVFLFTAVAGGLMSFGYTFCHGIAG